MKNLISCTVQVLTRNSMPGIKACLESLAAFAEVLVQDGNSTDGTHELAASFPNVRIIDQNKKLLDADGRITDFAAMRNEGLQVATYDWFMHIDADEEIEEAFVQEIASIVEKNEQAAYRVFRRFTINGKRIELSAAYPAFQIRLFHRSVGDKYVKSVHERISLKPGAAVHQCHTELLTPLPLPQLLEAKYQRYLRMEADRVKHISWWRWFRWIFLRNLLSSSMYVMRLARIWLIPTKAMRLPLFYEWQFVRYSLQAIIYTIPGRQKQ